MRMFDLSISSVVLRFYLMMACVIIGVLTHFWLLTLVALPIFLSIIMGVSFKRK